MSQLKRFCFESLEDKTLLAADLAIVDILPSPEADTQCSVAHPLMGDANGDGAFDTSDLVKVMQAAEYEDGINENSEWCEGDFNGDGDFTTDDLVAAWQEGMYEGQPDGDGGSRVPWDVNADDFFNSSDIIVVFLHGRYEDDGDPRVTAEQGDWNGDGLFNSSDLVLAMQSGQYEAGRII